MLKGFLASLAFASLVSGCIAPGAPSVRSTITTFHQIAPSSAAGKQLAILPYPPDKVTSLEFVTYRSILAPALAQKGFVVVEDPAAAEWLAIVSYGVDGGQQQTDVVSIPSFGQTSSGTTYHSGSMYGSGGGYGSYSGTSYTMPTFGITGYSTHDVSSTIYTRNLAIDIVEKTSFERGVPAKLYEGRAVSRGSCGSLAAVFNSISEALLMNWPGVSGEAETIDAPWSGRC